MPYSIHKDSRCDDSKPFAVVKDDDNEVMGCHATRDDAVKQIAALNAQESATTKLENDQHRFVEALQEAVDIGSNGHAVVRVIVAGKGASAIYPADVLERDGPQVFTAGTKMYWDHPSMTESWERPERSLRDLAGVLTSDAQWIDGALYADAKVFSPYFSALKEIKDYTGVSVRVIARTVDGEIQDGLPVVESLVEAESVDFVTTPGAGGQVTQLFESARTIGRGDGTVNIKENVEMGEVEQLKESISKLTEERDNTNTKLSEANEKITKLQEDLNNVTLERDRMRESVVTAQADTIIKGALAEAALPDITKERINKHVVATGVKLTESGELDKNHLNTVLAETIKAEKEYLESIGSTSVVRGVGSADNNANNSNPDALIEAFKDMGMDEESAKIAANGRV